METFEREEWEYCLYGIGGVWQPPEMLSGLLTHARLHPGCRIYRRAVAKAEQITLDVATADLTVLEAEEEARKRGN